MIKDNSAKTQRRRHITQGRKYNNSSSNGDTMQCVDINNTFLFSTARFKNLDLIVPQ